MYTNLPARIHKEHEKDFPKRVLNRIIQSMPLDLHSGRKYKNKAPKKGASAPKFI